MSQLFIGSSLIATIWPDVRRRDEGPRSPPTRKQDKIGRFQMLIRADAEPERIVLGKIGEVCAGRTDHGYRQEIGELGQRIEGARIDTRVFGDDHWVAGLNQPLGQPMHVRRQGHAGGRRRHDDSACGGVQSASMYSSGTST